MRTLERTPAPRQAVHGASNSIQPRTSPTSKQKAELPAAAELRPLFAGQARLLAERSERGLPIDVRSLFNLACAYLAIAEAERDDGEAAA
jgi:hypothetical protein